MMGSVATAKHIEPDWVVFGTTGTLMQQAACAGGGEFSAMAEPSTAWTQRLGNRTIGYYGSRATQS